MLAKSIEKHINGKDTKRGDLEKKIDLDDADIFDEVNNGSDNEDLHVLKRLGKTHSLGDGKVFKANNNATLLKIDIPKNVQNLDIVETNNGELAFGYDYTVKAKCMMEGCPVAAKVQQLFSDESTFEEKLTIQFDGDIYHKLG